LGIPSSPPEKTRKCLFSYRKDSNPRGLLPLRKCKAFLGKSEEQGPAKSGKRRRQTREERSVWESLLLRQKRHESVFFLMCKNLKISYFKSISNEETQTIVLRKDINKRGESHNEAKDICFQRRSK